MVQKKKLAGIYLAILGVVIFSTVSLRTAAILTDFNPSTNFFDEKNLIKPASWILTIGCIFLFSYALLAKKDEKLIASFTTPLTFVPTGALWIALIYFAIGFLSEAKSFGFDYRTLLTFKNIGASLTFYLGLLAFLTIGYFLLAAMSEERMSEARAAFGIFAVVFLALYTYYLYFDSTLSYNAPNKIVDQMAYIFAALFFLYEIRISLGRECWHLYMTFGFVAAALTAYSSIPSLVYYFTEEKFISDNIYENLLTLCLFVFILSRLTLASSLKEDKSSEIVSFMRISSQKRDEYVKSTQFSIDMEAREILNAEVQEDSLEDIIQEDSSLIDDDLVEIIESQASEEKADLISEENTDSESETNSEETEKEISMKESTDIKTMEIDENESNKEKSDIATQNLHPEENGGKNSPNEEQLIATPEKEDKQHETSNPHYTSQEEKSEEDIPEKEGI